MRTHHKIIPDNKKFPAVDRMIKACALKVISETKRDTKINIRCIKQLHTMGCNDHEIAKALGIKKDSLYFSL